MTRPSCLLSWLPWLLLVSSCSSPPKPPTVDESRKRPVNAAAAIELQTCRSDLQNTCIFAAKSARSAEASGRAVARVVQQQQLLAQSIQANAAAHRNLLVPVLFAFGSAELTVPEADAHRIVEEARDAPLIAADRWTNGFAGRDGDRQPPCRSRRGLADLGRHRPGTHPHDPAARGQLRCGQHYGRRSHAQPPRRDRDLPCCPAVATAGALVASLAQRAAPQ